MRRLLSLVLCIACMFSCITFSGKVLAADEPQGDLSSWTYFNYNTQKGIDFDYELDDTSYRSGSHSLKVQYYTPMQSYHALQINQTVPVEPGKTYVYGISAKGQRAANVVINLNNAKRTSLLPLGSTFDWIDFQNEYTIPEGITSLMYVITVENITKNVWFDDVFVREKTENGLGENLIKNPGFDKGGNGNIDKTEIQTKENIYRKAYNEGLTKDKVSLDEFNKLYGILDEIQLQKTSGITIDGNLDEWDGQPEFAINLFDRMNVLKEPTENWGGVRASYDDKNLYVSMSMYDKVHSYQHGANYYWRSDSLQIAFCSEGESYGQEFGFVCDPKEDVLSVYSSTASEEELEKVIYKSSRDEKEGMTYYEVAIPWEIYYKNGRPDSMLFCACVNDSDTGGRNIMDLRPGISTSKSSEKFMKFTFEEDNKSPLYLAVAGPEKAYTYQDTNYTIYLVNKGEEKTVELYSEEFNLSEKVRIGKNEVLKKNFTLAPDVMGNASFKAMAKYDNGVKEASFTTLFEPGEAKINEILNRFDGYAAELKPLLDECKEKNISTNYETLWYTLLTKCTQWMRDDIALGDLTRIGYNEEWLTKYYEQAKVNLTGYLDGTLVPADIPELVSGKLDITANSVWANTKTKNGTEKRPVYPLAYVGYGDLDSALSWQGDIGVTMLMDEIQVSDILKQGTGDTPFVADFTSKAAQQFLTNLKVAQEKNMRISVLLAPHVFPDWFGNSYKDLKYKGPTGSNLSQYILAPAYRQALEVFIRAVMEEIKDFKNLDSICLSNETRHWTSAHPEYYGPYWAYYLSQEYGADISKLNSAYGTNYAEFTDVPMPSSPTADRAFYDYYYFNCKAVNEVLVMMGDIIHEYLPDIALHSKVMPQMQSSDHAGARAAMQFGIDIDMYSEWAGIAGNDAMCNLGGDLLEKFMYYDWQHSIIQKPVFDSENHLITDSDENFTHEQAQWVESTVWNGMMHNNTLTAMWNWSRNRNNPVLWGGLCWRPDALEALGRISLDSRRLGLEIDALVSKEPEVAILYSTNSRIYNLEHQEACFNVYRAANMNGQKVEFISENQIDRIHNYKLLVLPCVNTADAATVDAVYKYAQNGGKLLIFGDNPMKQDGKQNVNDVSKIDFIKNNATVIAVDATVNRISSPTRAEFEETILTSIKDSGIDRVQLIDIETSSRVDEVEYCWVEYNGKMHINILNHQWENPKKIKVVIDGLEATEIIDLRGSKPLESQFVVEPYTPMFIRIDK